MAATLIHARTTRSLLLQVLPGTSEHPHHDWANVSKLRRYAPTKATSPLDPCIRPFRARDLCLSHTSTVVRERDDGSSTGTAVWIAELELVDEAKTSVA